MDFQRLHDACVSISSRFGASSLGTSLSAREAHLARSYAGAHTLMNIVHVRCPFYVGATDQEPNERTSTKQRLWCSPPVRVYPSIEIATRCWLTRPTQLAARTGVYMYVSHATQSTCGGCVCAFHHVINSLAYVPLHSRPAAHELGGRCCVRCDRRSGGDGNSLRSPSQ